jgi:hypothetical protein
MDLFPAQAGDLPQFGFHVLKCCRMIWLAVARI